MSKRVSTLSIVGLLSLAVAIIWGRTSVAPASTAGGDGDRKEQKAVGLAEAIFGALRTAAPRQFPTSESAVSFLLEQVKQQDVDEAARAFPIKQFYERHTFEGGLRHHRIVDPNGPFPGQPFANVMRAMWPLSQFTRTSLALLGQRLDHPAVIDSPVTDDKIAEMVAKYDFEKLRGLNVTALNETKRSPMPGDSPAAQLLGIIEVAELEADVAVGTDRYRLNFSANRLSDNWYVNRMEGVRKLDPGSP